jgi:hypothetical protein
LDYVQYVWSFKPTGYERLAAQRAYEEMVKNGKTQMHANGMFYVIDESDGNFYIEPEIRERTCGWDD